MRSQPIQTDALGHQNVTVDHVDDQWMVLGTKRGEGSMSVWFAIPSINAKNCEKNLPKWQEKGYKTAVYVKSDVDSALRADSPFLSLPAHVCNHLRAGPYFGWPDAVNRIARIVLLIDPACTAVVTGGDDMYPGLNDPNANVLEAEFLRRFPDTCGVMQPTGDRWMMDASGRAVSERICGSPWMGRRFILTSYQGEGPFWNGYWHFYADEELKEVTERDKMLWQRPDIMHYHDHWTRHRLARPEYMREAQSKWDSDKVLFERRKSAGFPKSEVLKS